MKTILVPIEANAGQAARLQAGFDLARAFGGQLLCVQTSGYAVYAAGDNGIGAFPITALVDAIDADRQREREAIEAQLHAEGVLWHWQAGDGDAADHIARAARLADIIVMNCGAFAQNAAAQVSMIGDVAIEAPAPVLAVPETSSGVTVAGPVMIAWDGSREAAVAMRAALPILQLATSVDILAIGEKPADLSVRDAATYLSRHGIAANVIERGDADDSIEAIIRAELIACGSTLLVQGAYGHSRLREAIFGGVTRGLLSDAPVPLLVAH